MKLPFLKTYQSHLEWACVFYPASSYTNTHTHTPVVSAAAALVPHSDAITRLAIAACSLAFASH